MALTLNVPITALNHPKLWTAAIALTAMPFEQPRKKRPAKNSLRLSEFCLARIWLASDRDEFAILESIEMAVLRQVWRDNLRALKSGLMWPPFLRGAKIDYSALRRRRFTSQ
jgi:hypothetical protein